MYLNHKKMLGRVLPRRASNARREAPQDPHDPAAQAKRTRPIGERPQRAARVHTAAAEHRQPSVCAHYAARGGRLSRHHSGRGPVRAHLSGRVRSSLTRFANSSRLRDQESASSCTGCPYSRLSSDL